SNVVISAVCPINLPLATSASRRVRRSRAALREVDSDDSRCRPEQFAFPHRWRHPYLIQSTSDLNNWPPLVQVGRKIPVGNFFGPFISSRPFSIGGQTRGTVHNSYKPGTTIHGNAL